MAVANGIAPQEDDEGHLLRREEENQAREDDEEALNMERLLLLQEEQERKQQQEEQEIADAGGAVAGRLVDNEAVDLGLQRDVIDNNHNHNRNNQNNGFNVNVNVNPLMNDRNNNNGNNDENNDAYLQYLYHNAHYRSKRMLLSLSYTSSSFFAAAALLVYAMRTREQWYLALVFVSSSKWAYVVLGNALIASCVAAFRFITKITLGGLRLHETEGLYDFFRWNVTETCLALTMFRSELTVGTGMHFLLLILTKCLHWVADLREGHLRMTEESIVVVEGTNAISKWFEGWPRLQSAHLKLCLLLVVLLVLDMLAVKMCGQDLFTSGPSVSILFAFEGAILLVSAWNNIILWNLHVLDGLVHYVHEHTSPKSVMHRFIHPWKENKATFIFAVELQSQAAKFLFYVTFFAIVLTYYGMPINLFREVYLSFQSLKQRLVAFAKYRKLMASMNKFPNVTSEEQMEQSGSGKTCIICREEMTVLDCKQLPGCGHIFHKSCLREWLVQQQSCPTCRGDIATMEREHTAKLARIAREEEQQQQQQQQQKENEDNNTSTDNDRQGDNKNKEITTEGKNEQEEPKKYGKSEEKLSQLTSDGEDNDKKERNRVLKATDSENIISQTAQQKVEQQREKFKQRLGNFPALCKIVRKEGTSVWHKPSQKKNETRDQQGSTPTLIRMIPYGVMILCLEQDDIAVGVMDNGRRSEEVRMLRIPEDLKQHYGCKELSDGTSWICEDDCFRLGDITLPTTEDDLKIENEEKKNV